MATKPIRIAFFIQYDLSTPSGLTKKLSREIKHWQDQGHNVKIFAFSKQLEVYSELKEDVILVEKYKSIIGLFLRGPKMWSQIHNWKPDLLYIRYNKPILGMRKLVKTIPTVLEINTNLFKEFSITSNPVLAKIYAWLSASIFYYSAGFCTLSDEIAALLSRYPGNKKVIGDSIVLADYKDRTSKDEKIEQPHFLFIGSKPMVWYGFENIIWLANKRPEWTFHIIGDFTDTKKDVSERNIIFHGHLEERQYRNIVEKCHIAIGSLGMYHIGLTNQTTLKLREYLALGLPSIIGYCDTDFKEGAPFILQLPNCKSSMENHIDDIDAFVNEWAGKAVRHDQIRHLDVAVKEEIRLAFFADILNG